MKILDSIETWYSEFVQASLAMQNQANKLLNHQTGRIVKVPLGHSPLILSSCSVYEGGKAFIWLQFQAENQTDPTEGFFV